VTLDGKGQRHRELRQQAESDNPPALVFGAGDRRFCWEDAPNRSGSFLPALEAVTFSVPHGCASRTRVVR